MYIIFVNKQLSCTNSVPEILNTLGGKANINMFANYFAGRYVYGVSEEVLQQAAANAKAFAANLAASGQRFIASFPVRRA